MAKKIILKRLVLSNWKSLNLDVKFNDKSTSVSGRNGIGKSSLQSAWNWLLSSYTSAVVPKNHELFDNRVELTHETPIASVKAWVAIDGVEYTIEKTAQAKFTRKRGSYEYVKDSSDSYKILIDDIEVSATNYTQWIETNICPTDMLVYCLEGSFFTVLADDDKKKARKVLETIVGEIKQEDFTGNYDVLANDFAKGYTVEQIEERTKNQIKPIKDRMVKIPALVEDKEKLLSEYQKIDYVAIEKRIAETRADIQQIDNQILGNGEAIKPILGQRDAIFDLINSMTLKLIECRNVYLSGYNAIRNEIKGKIGDIDRLNQDIQTRYIKNQREYEYNCRNLDELKRGIKNSETFIEDLRKQRDEIKSRVFVAETCSYCGQELPAEKQDELKAKFNERKQSELEYVIAQGKRLAAKIEDDKKRIAELEEIVAKGVELEELQSAEILQQQLKAHEETFVQFEETKEYKELNKEIDELKASLPTIPQNDNEELTNAKNALLNRLESLNQELGGKYKAEQIKSELSSLQSELSELGITIAQLEGVLAKCQDYREEIANIISMRVNGRLKDCQIQMWETQKNGDMIPSCIVTDNSGVKYSTLNNSKRLKTAIELQRMFCDHFGLLMPFFIDEYNVFDGTYKVGYNDTQMIYLNVSNSSFLIIE